MQKQDRLSLALVHVMDFGAGFDGANRGVVRSERISVEMLEPIAGCDHELHEATLGTACLTYAVESIAVTARSHGTQKAAFDLLADSRAWPSWGGAGSVDIERPGDAAGVGEIRVMRNGPLRVREEIVAIVPPKLVQYVLLSGLPVRDYEARVEITPDESGSIIHWRARFGSKVPGAGAVNRLIFRKVLQRTAAALADAAAQRPPEKAG